MSIKVELQENEIVLIVEALYFLGDHPAFDEWERLSMESLANRLAGQVPKEAFDEASQETRRLLQILAGGGDAPTAG